jgi:hypothetical protein
MINFNGLADELLLCIFAKLTAERDLESVSLVSRKWHRVVNDHQLWGHLPCIHLIPSQGFPLEIRYRYVSRLTAREPAVIERVPTQEAIAGIPRLVQFRGQSLLLYRYWSHPFSKGVRCQNLVSGETQVYNLGYGDSVMGLQLHYIGFDDFFVAIERPDPADQQKYTLTFLNAALSETASPELQVGTDLVLGVHRYRQQEREGILVYSSRNIRIFELTKGKWELLQEIVSFESLFPSLVIQSASGTQFFSLRDNSQLLSELDTTTGNLNRWTCHRFMNWSRDDRDTTAFRLSYCQLTSADLDGKTYVIVCRGQYIQIVPCGPAEENVGSPEWSIKLPSSLPDFYGLSAIHPSPLKENFVLVFQHARGNNMQTHRWLLRPDGTVRELGASQIRSVGIWADSRPLGVEHMRGSCAEYYTDGEQVTRLELLGQASNRPSWATPRPLLFILATYLSFRHTQFIVDRATIGLQNPRLTTWLVCGFSFTGLAGGGLFVGVVSTHNPSSRVWMPALCGICVVAELGWAWIKGYPMIEWATSPSVTVWSLCGPTVYGAYRRLRPDLLTTLPAPPPTTSAD